MSKNTFMLISILVICLVILLASTMLTDCSTGLNKANMKDYFEKTITLPSVLEHLDKDSHIGSIQAENLNMRHEFTLIHIFNSSEKIEPQAEQLKSTLKKMRNVNTLFIADATNKKQIAEESRRIKFPFPIYFTKGSDLLLRLNGLPQKDHSFNTLLMDHQNRLLAKGAFFDNPEILKEFEKTMDCYTIDFSGYHHLYLDFPHD